MKAMDDPFFGAYPDWREPGPAFDNLTYLKKVLPYAKGMSYRNQPDDQLTITMLDLCRQSGFHGWYGIESDGRDAIRKAIRLLKTQIPGHSK
jgi:L-ribulose-5-phosphate 3-epimerase